MILLEVRHSNERIIMDKDKKCGFFACLWHHKTEIFGFLLILLGALATLVSFSGLGLLGMLIVGLCLFRGHCFKCPCCRSQECSDNMGECHLDIKPIVKKVAKPKAK
jgi:hypothetical protein